ncbi:uncharacterized protein BDV17DRAFT_287297 [Aspergillus undulatus]|uniref:uncharacterized protein n=1 Tax=Aspergillus undulatus TaxID=1810928 RepID=UPI003CCD311A
MSGSRTTVYSSSAAALDLQDVSQSSAAMRYCASQAARREPQFRPFANIARLDFSRHANREALMVQCVGEVVADPCTHCTLAAAPAAPGAPAVPATSTANAGNDEPPKATASIENRSSTESPVGAKRKKEKRRKKEKKKKTKANTKALSRKLLKNAIELLEMAVSLMPDINDSSDGGGSSFSESESGNDSDSDASDEW